MPLTRRRFLRSATASAVLPTLAGRAWSQTRLPMGELTLTTLSDGNLVLPGSMILGDAPEDEAAEILNRYNILPDRFEPECNVTLLQTGDRTVLFDVGAGPNFMPTAGRLFDALAQVDVDPFDVTDVVFTHAHPDHLWGLIDDFGDLAFPDAAYHIGQTEWDYWTDPDTVSSIGEARVGFAVGAASRLAEIADRITLNSNGQSVLPGVTAVDTPGHTPGHMAYALHAGTDSAMVIGDSIANHHIAFERPGWASGSDQDPTLGATTRLKLLDQLATDQIRIAGFHMPNGGVGHVERRGESFVFTGEES